MTKGIFKKLELGLEKAKLKVVVAMACNDEALIAAIRKAFSLGFVAEVTLITADEAFGLDLKAIGDCVKVIGALSHEKALELAVIEAKQGKAQLLCCCGFVGHCLSEAVNFEDDCFLSHISLFKLPDQEKELMLTDALINLSPNEADLVKEIENAKHLYSRLWGESCPKVALLAANEKVSEKMSSTKLAKAVSETLADKGDFVVEGPVSFDLAISSSSAKIKRYGGKIQGDADILVAPRVETADVLYKSFQHYIKLEMASVVYGANYPIVHSFCADSAKTKYNSLILGLYLGKK